jgi:hypothetical protein
VNSQKVISEAWQITFKHKYLWIFGFIAGLTYGSENIGVSVTQGGAWLFQNLETVLSAQGIIAILSVVISVVLWLLGLIARICLIQDISIGVQAEKLLPKAIELFRSSTPFLVTIVLMQILVWSPVILINILLSVWARPMAESLSESVTSGGVPDLTSFGTIWLLGMGTLFLTIPLSFVDAFSYRSLVVENLGVGEGIKKGVTVLRRNWKPILGLALLCLIIGLAFSFAVSMVLLPLSFAMLPLMQRVLMQCAGGGDLKTMTTCMQGLRADPIFIVISLTAGILSAAISSVWVTFQSSAFTLAYIKLKG